MATIKDIAKMAGVSTSTVSHVVNRTRYVSPELVEKVERAIQELDELPNFSFEYGETIMKIIDKTNIDHYRIYLVAFNVWIFDDDSNENMEIDNVCKLRIRIYNKDIPNFEMVNINNQ